MLLLVLWYHIGREGPRWERRDAFGFSESDLTLALNHGPRPPEPLPALLADKRACAKRLIQVRLREDAVSADAAAKPRGERLLVGEGARVHRAKFRGEEIRLRRTAPI